MICCYLRLWPSVSSLPCWLLYLLSCPANQLIYLTSVMCPPWTGWQSEREMQSKGYKHWRERMTQTIEQFSDERSIDDAIRSRSAKCNSRHRRLRDAECNCPLFLLLCATNRPTSTQTSGSRSRASNAAPERLGYAGRLAKRPLSLAWRIRRPSVKADTQLSDDGRDWGGGVYLSSSSFVVVSVRLAVPPPVATLEWNGKARNSTALPVLSAGTRHQREN